MMWRGALFVDTALPFGLRLAPEIFTAVADAVEWIARSEGVDFVIHYLDEFLVMGDPGSSGCAVALQKLLDICQRLGLPVAQEKLEGPSSCLVFLGFELDSRDLVVQLPQQKLTELKALIGQWERRKSCTMTELESLVGKLAHTSSS